MAGLGDILGGPAAWAIPEVRKGINQLGSQIHHGLMGSPERMEQYSTVTPEQQGYLSQLLQKSMGGLQENQKNFNFDNIENRARSDFQSKTLPGIRELFENMGSGEGSSAYQPALASAGADLESNLGMMRNQYGQQQHGNLMQMLQMGMRPQVENMFRPAQQGLFGNMMGGIGQGAGQGIGQLLPLLMML